MNGDIDKSTNRDTASKNVVNHGKPNNEQFQAVYNYFLHPQPQCGFWLAKLWILPRIKRDVKVSYQGRDWQLETQKNLEPNKNTT